MWKSLLNRFKEASSWAGLSVLLALFGVNLPPGALEAIIQLLAALAGTAAVFVPEAKSTVEPAKVSSVDQEPGRGHLDA